MKKEYKELLELYKLAQGKKVLLVEDDQNIASQIQEILEEVLMDVTSAYNGEDGYNKYKAKLDESEKGHFYDLIITDVKMPKMNGIELIQKIYALNSEQKIIVISAYSDLDDLVELINMGVFRFISKPVEYKYFIKTLHDVCQMITIKKTIEKKQETTNKVMLKEKMLWDREKSLLFKDEVNIVKLSKNEIALMKLLLSDTQRVFTSLEIIEYVWKTKQTKDVNRGNVKFLINRIRKKIAKDSIENLYDIGYRFVLP